METSTQSTKNRAEQLLKKMLGDNSSFRSGQWEAIETVVIKKQKALIVQRTGWGKSLVYFLSTKLLREQGAGPTLLISPLLSLMRNQIEMAEKIGIRAITINSTNQKAWSKAEEALKTNSCDILLVSPERLNNEHFLKQVLPTISGQIGLFVVDEAHCISDWGHDFRPDYRRITRILQILPKSVPIIGTTATANNRVIKDVQEQLGSNLTVLRGSLARESLRLQNINLSSQGERLAWLAENLPKFKGSGIIYCMTVADTERVAGWLRSKGFKAEAYHAGDDGAIDREALEQSFLKNEIDILVATVALGMGFDKPDIAFVIHFQCPGSVVAYYQQVGRAGRAVDKSYGILLGGEEDEEIQNYFINSAFPEIEVFQAILGQLEKSEGLSIFKILSRVNFSQHKVETALNLLEVDGAVGKTTYRKRLYFRTPNPWNPDIDRIKLVTALRRAELDQMQQYLHSTDCLMKFLMDALDDPHPYNCGRCSNCRGKGLSKDVSPEMVIEAENYLKGMSLIIYPRKLLPTNLLPGQKRFIPSEFQNGEGRSLCYYNDPGRGILVKQGKYTDGKFDIVLEDAAVHLIMNVWRPDPFPVWVTAIPSLRHPTLVANFSKNIASKLGIPFYPILQRISNAPEQKTMQNSSMQARNVIGTLEIEGDIPKGPVLLIDDIVDSGWTLTMAGFLLRKKGSDIVYPFTLAKATGKG